MKKNIGSAASRCNTEEHLVPRRVVRPLIVGHRGAMAHLPENSLASYALAERVGVDEIELDVRLSADGELFLLHDATLDRTAGDDSARGLGPVAHLSLDQLSSVILDSGRGVVTLAEMYEATNTFIQLEIKDPAVVPFLAVFFEQNPEAAERTALASFDADAIHHSAELMPTVERQIIVESVSHAEDFPGGLFSLIEYTGATRFACGFPGLTPQLVESLRDRGVKTHVWPIRTPRDMEEALRLDAEGATADDPEQARSWRDEILTRR